MNRFGVKVTGPCGSCTSNALLFLALLQSVYYCLYVTYLNLTLRLTGVTATGLDDCTLEGHGVDLLLPCQLVLFLEGVSSSATILTDFLEDDLRPYTSIQDIISHLQT